MTLLLYHCRVCNYSTGRVVFASSDHTAGDEKTFCKYTVKPSRFCGKRFEEFYNYIEV